MTKHSREASDNPPPVDERVSELEARITNVEARLEATTRNYLRLVDVLQAKLGPLEAPPPPKKPTLEIIENAPPCPKHPEAPQTANGCTEPSCSYSPPAQAAQDA